MAWYDDPKLREKKLRFLIGPEPGTLLYRVLEDINYMHPKILDRLDNMASMDPLKRELEMYNEKEKGRLLDKSTIENIRKSYK